MVAWRTCVQDREKEMGAYVNALAQWSKTVYTPVREDIKAYTYMPHCQLSARKQLVSKAKRSSLQNVKTVHEWNGCVADEYVILVATYLVCFK